MAPPVPLTAGVPVHWDRRFVVRAEGAFPGALAGTITVGGLGTDGGAGLRELARGAIPAIGLPGLPAIRDLDGVLAVPHLNYCRQGLRVDTISRLSVLPDPAVALAGTGGLTEPGGIDVGR